MSVAAVLHNIRSAYNVGSIFRTADGAGIERLYLCGITPDPVDRFGRAVSKISKVALGAEKNVSWKHYESTGRCIAFLKKQGYRVFAIERNRNSVLYTSVTINKGEDIALVLGNEVEGLPDTILKLADAILEIPMHGSKESLNVAVAFGIAVYKLVERG
ncbi:TrmH family RNA methyltransferase [Candidatus Uhrbacteria bacterium]|nr:TrmH family RNA methyltransferase [Candidatus Uhrbacteria bacterium]